jgi:magnesium transporter
MAVIEKIRLENLVWIDVTEPSNAEMEELSEQYSLNKYTVRDCMQPEHLPKYEYDEDCNVHFLILRFYAHSVDKHLATIQELTDKVAIFCNEKFLITIHKSPTPFLEPIARKYHSRGKDLSVTELLSRIVWHTLETYDAPAERLSERVDFYEDKVLLRRADTDVTEALYYIKRQAAVSHKVLLLMQEPINHINFAPGEEAFLQDVKDQHLKMLTLYAQITEETNHLVNLCMSFAAQRTNDVMRVLTLFSAFFLPLTFIVGIYGMNFKYMPELDQKWGYPAVVVVMAIVTIGIYVWFKRKKWL